MSSSNCCFPTSTQGSQQAGQVVWHFHLLKNFPQFIVIHTVKSFDIVNKAEIDIFSGTLLLFQWSSTCWIYTRGAKARNGGCTHRSGWEEIPHIQGQEQLQWGATTGPRLGVVAERNYPMSTVRSSHEEIPHIQDKRNPSKMVGTERGHQKADTLKPQSQTTSQSDHMDNRPV